MIVCSTGSQGRGGPDLCVCAGPKGTSRALRKAPAENSGAAAQVVILDAHHHSYCHHPSPRADSRGAYKTGKIKRGSQDLYLKAPAGGRKPPPSNLDLRTGDLYDRLVRKQNYLLFAVDPYP
jgi:hypothetical protein